MTSPPDEIEKKASPDTDRLAEAYLRTTYRVWAPGRELLLRVGKVDAGLAKVLREAWVQGAVLLTAWNPGSRPCTREVNESAQQRLLEELALGGHPCLRARNEPDAAGAAGEDWTEDSVLALGITRETARALALRYGQVAFLWIDERAAPQLVIAAAGA